MRYDLADLDHDTWQYELPRIRSAGAVSINDIPGALPYTGVRNPLTTSSVSHKVAFTYRTAANGWQRKVGAAESMAEAAVAMEALVSPMVHDVEFQPATFPYPLPDGRVGSHTIDLRITYVTGLRRFIFVRNQSSLSKPQVQTEIDAIHAAVPEREAHEFIVVDGDAYSRPRRENLCRMHHLVHFAADPESDAVVSQLFAKVGEVWHLSQLFGQTSLPKPKIFKSVMRLLARGELEADRDSVICEHSRVWVAQHD
jgi:hypothetical protein